MAEGARVGRRCLAAMLLVLVVVGAAGAELEGAPAATPMVAHGSGAVGPAAASVEDGGRGQPSEISPSSARADAPTRAAAPPAAGPAAPRSGCAPARHDAGDWPTLNGDAANTRHQRSATDRASSPGWVPRPVWSFDGASVGATGGMRSTPIVAGGCVYIGLGQGYLGDRGDVVALNADTGALVWHAVVDGSVLGLTAANGLIYAAASRGTRGELVLPVVTEAYAPTGITAVAFDARTGAQVWQSERLDDGNPRNGTFVNATPVAFDAGGRHLLFVPLAGGAGDGAMVPMYFLDALSGETVARELTLTEAEYATGFGGTGIWTTAAFDAATQHLYAGTSDSDGTTRQHPFNNAILKIDANPARPTFGEVVGAYRGTTEHADLDALIGYPHNPLCGALADVGLPSPTFFDTSASPDCLELDLDFGASPNLYRDARGRLRVGALQKSGIYHSVDAATMQPAWRFFVGPGGPAMNSATAAVGDGRVHVGATPNSVFALHQDTGRLGWLGTTGVDALAYQPLTLAGGLLYAINDVGSLVGLDARSGAPRFHRSIALDGGFASCLGVGAGVAVARDVLYVPCDGGGLPDLAGLPAAPGGLVAYR